ncbi:MAG: hypothetical protein OXG87_23435, partial [Gemmatimonadetes bacterium]|nr:hypothetical protein [Gemmatimonadota bacterium]
YLEERGYLRPSDQFHQAYKEVEHKAHQIHLMMLKLRALGEIKKAWEVDRILKIITSLDDISQREERILKNVLKAL